MSSAPPDADLAARGAESDMGTVPGWWPVAAEASDAIDALEGRDVADRCPGWPNDGLGDPDRITTSEARHIGDAVYVVRSHDIPSTE